MIRRHLLVGLAAAGLELDAQEPPPESLYIPKPHLVEDRKMLDDFMDEFAFADLITAAPGIRITHIPVIPRPRVRSLRDAARPHRAP